MDYNSEGNLVRRLNDLGCKNVVKVVDWFRVGDGFRTCFEFAEFGDLGALLQFNGERRYQQSTPSEEVPRLRLLTARTDLLFPRPLYGMCFIAWLMLCVTVDMEPTDFILARPVQTGITSFMIIFTLTTSY